MHLVIYSPGADRDLDELDFRLARRIVAKIQFFSEHKNPLTFAKPLSDPSLGGYRFRIGDYRAIFDIDSRGNIKILMILRVKHRKDVYRD